ncbi:hypothetical protein [Marinifilum fragile]|nr:hypothetical protein [Marinifilum fragile]
MTNKYFLLGLAFVAGLTSCEQKAEESKKDSSYKLLKPNWHQTL